jgi:maltose O-acetyltransferase
VADIEIMTNQQSFTRRIINAITSNPGGKTVIGAIFSFCKDFQLLMLTIIGYVPSHRFRNLVYSLNGFNVSKSSAVHWRARFFAPSGLTLGEYSTIGNDAFLDGRAGLCIGSCVNIAGEVRIYTYEHDINDPDFRGKGAPVIIEDYAYLGTRVTVLPGVRIGEGAVVASGAVVTKDVNPYSLVGGVPARFISDRTRNLRYKCGTRVRFQ